MQNAHPVPQPEEEQLLFNIAPSHNAYNGHNSTAHTISRGVRLVPR